MFFLFGGYMFCAHHTECTEGLSDFLIISHSTMSGSHLVPVTFTNHQSKSFSPSIIHIDHGFHRPRCWVLHCLSWTIQSTGRRPQDPESLKRLQPWSDVFEEQTYLKVWGSLIRIALWTLDTAGKIQFRMIIFYVCCAFLCEMLRLNAISIPLQGRSSVITRHC